MTRARTRTKLPLDRFGEIMGIHPVHFAGLYVEGFESLCTDPWMQYEWQASQRVSREELARAIRRAETNIETYLGYRLLPDWEINEWRQAERSPKPELLRTIAIDPRGMASVVEAKWKHFIAGGIRSQELIEAGVAITFSDPDGDTYDELATSATVTTTLPVCEVRAYLPGRAGADAYEIRPVTVTDNNDGTYTLTMKREQLVKPDLQEDYIPPSDDSHHRGLDGLDDTNFESTIDVYRVYNDPQQQVTFMWEPFSTWCGDCGGSGCEMCAYTAQTGCLMLRSEPRLGMVAYRPATWNSTTLQFDSAAWSQTDRAPGIVRLYYYAGLQDNSLDCPRVQMTPEWEQTVAIYAASLLTTPICSCDNVKVRMDYWQETVTDEFKSLGIRSQSIVDNPLGARRGAVETWSRIKDPGVAIGRGAS